MTRTRAEIKTAVNYNTGRATEKAALIETLCNEALKIAIDEHPFEDSKAFNQDFAITTSSYTASIATLTSLAHVLSATIIETSGDRNMPLKMKNETWWAENVVNPEDNAETWPTYGLKRGTNIIFDCPVQAGLSLRLIVSNYQTFSTDSTTCPIAIADIFVTQYVTALVFLSLNEHEKYEQWYKMAMGMQYLINGKVGGTLASIIDKDKKSRAEVFEARQSNMATAQSQVAVQNLITGHDDYGNVRLWSAR